MTVLSLAHLVNGFLASRGAEHTEPDDDGVFQIEADDGTSIAVEWNASCDCILVYANPGYLRSIDLDSAGEEDDDEFDDPPRDSTVFTSESDDGVRTTLHVHARTRLVTLSATVALRTTGPADFARLIEDFVSDLEIWPLILRTESSPTPSEPERRNAPLAHDLPFGAVMG